MVKEVPPEVLFFGEAAGAVEVDGFDNVVGPVDAFYASPEVVGLIVVLVAEFADGQF